MRAQVRASPIPFMVTVREAFINEGMKAVLPVTASQHWTLLNNSSVANVAHIAPAGLSTARIYGPDSLPVRADALKFAWYVVFVRFRAEWLAGGQAGRQAGRHAIGQSFLRARRQAGGWQSRSRPGGHPVRHCQIIFSEGCGSRPPVRSLSTAKGRGAEMIMAVRSWQVIVLSAACHPMMWSCWGCAPTMGSSSHAFSYH